MEDFSHLYNGFSAMSPDALVRTLIDATARGSVDLLPIDGAGVVLLPPGTSAGQMSASDPVALRFEWLQGSLGQGPCFAAHDAMAAHCVPDLTLAEGFPQFAAAARYLGLAAVFAFPLRHDGVCLGALDLYRMAPGALGEVETHAAQHLADVLAGDIVRARRPASHGADSSGTQPDGGLARALHEERAFVATLIHELGGSLAAISGFTWLLENAAEDLSVSQRRSVTAIHRSSDDLRALTADLLTLLTLDAPATRTPAQRDVVELRAVARRVEDTALASLAGGPSVTFHLPEAPIVVRGEADQLERMLTNLLSNAIKYTPSEGSVSCGLSRVRGDAVFEVRDTGIGIHADEQEKLFTRFFRGSTAKARGIPGTGLGLAIVEAVVHAHDGTVSLSSTLGAGTDVIVRIPIMDAAEGMH